MLRIPEKLKELKRFEQVAQVLIKNELGFVLTSMRPKSNKETEPEVIRETIEDLGGSFVKLGQILSLRPDLIPNRYCEELSKLQDEVRPFSYKQAKQIIETETKQKIKDNYTSINKNPEASASIGQVHKGELKDKTKVAIKIQRPNTEQIFSTDIDIMMFLAKLIENMPGTKVIDPVEIIESFKEYTAKEIKYTNELENIKIFHQNFLNTNITIPRPYPDLSTDKVLVMEFIKGQKLTEYLKQKKPEPEKKELAREIFNSFLKQIFIDGYFHADPHPGNIMKTEEGIALIDFGIVGEFKPEMKAALLNLFMALYAQDIDKAAENMMRLHIINEVNTEMKNEVRQLLAPYYNLPTNKIDVPKLFIQSLKIAKKHNIKVPKDLVVLGKTVLTLESTCTKIYPEFNFVEESKPFITRMLIHEYSPKKTIAQNIEYFKKIKNLLEDLPDNIETYFRNTEQQNKNMEELSIHVQALENKFEIITEKAFVTIIIIILFITGFLLINKTPMVEGMSIFSIISFLLGLAIIYTQIKKSIK